MNESLIKSIQNWFNLQCNSDWEHQFGIRIESLDNPGWMLKIDLVGTNLEDVSFKQIKTERNDDDWVHCSVEGNVFKGYGGPLNLEELLKKFIEFIQVSNKQ